MRDIYVLQSARTLHRMNAGVCARWWYSQEVEFVVFALNEAGTIKLLFQSWRIHISFRSFSFGCRTLWSIRIWLSNATRRSIRKWRLYRVCCTRMPSPQTGSLCHGTTLLISSSHFFMTCFRLTTTRFSCAHIISFCSTIAIVVVSHIYYAQAHVFS